MAFDGSNLFVTNNEDDSVSEINPATNTATIPVGDGPVGDGPVGDGPVGVAFDGTNIYVANSLEDTVSKLIPR